MPYKGHVEGGAIVLDEPVTLEDGTIVDVEGRGARTPAAVSSRSRSEHYRSVIGTLDSMPEDWAENHDSYLSGQNAT